jgi:hypothetical protein
VIAAGSTPRVANAVNSGGVKWVGGWRRDRPAVARGTV